MGDDNGESGLLTTAATIFGLFAGVAAILYVGGGAVIALRMSWQRVPNALSVVSQLPREFLISTGLAQLVLPLLLVAGVYVSMRVVRGEGERRTLPVGATKQEWTGSATMRRWLTFLVVVSSAYAITLPGLLVVSFSSEDVRADAWFFTVAPVLTAIVVLIVLYVRATLQGQRFKTPTQWNKIKPILMMASLYALAALPGVLLFSSALPLQPVRVCAAGGAYMKDGLLVAEASDRIYVAENAAEPAPRRILTLPIDRIEEIFVGDTAWKATCDTVPTT